jgi:hypothetical protein
MATDLPEHPPDIQPGRAGETATAQILDHLCRCCGTTLPALIFRHLATREGLLPAFWGHLGGLFESGKLQRAAWPLIEQLDTQGLIGASPGLQTLDAHTLGRALATLEQYNRSNPVNLLALLTVLHQVNAGPNPATQANDPPEDPPWQAPQPPAEVMLPMVELSTIDRGTRWLINDLRSGDRSQLDTVVPSLYRHFVPYPEVLHLLHHWLAPRFADGQMAARAQTLVEQFETRAAGLASGLGSVPVMLREPEVLATLEDFAQRVIPTMIIVGCALQRALRDEGATLI